MKKEYDESGVDPTMIIYEDEQCVFVRKRRNGLNISQRKKKATTVKKLNTVLFIDGENISFRKANKVFQKAKEQGKLYESKVYGLQNDVHTMGWKEKAKEYHIKDIRLFGEPQKDKVDKKIQGDIRRVTANSKNVDVVCIATSDSGYISTINYLRSQGKRVVVIGERKASVDLRGACSKFIEI